MNEGILVTLAFFLLIGLIYRPVKGAIINILDQNSNQVSKALDEAAAIRTEAQENLTKIKAKLKEAEVTAENIIKQAQQESLQLTEEAREKAQALYSKKIAMAEENFKNQEQNLISEIKEQAANQAIKMLKDGIAADLQNDNLDKALDQSIANIKKTVH